MDYWPLSADFTKMQTLSLRRQACTKLDLAIWVIATIGCGRTIEDRKEISRYTDQLAATIKARPNSEDAKKALVELIDVVNSDWRFGRCRACYALGEIGQSSAAALPDLMRAAICGDQYVEGAAVHALASMGRVAAPAVDLLIDKLEFAMSRYSEGNETWDAVKALGNIGEPARRCVPVLERAAKSKDKYLAEEAQNSLKKLTGLSYFDLDTERLKLE